VFLLGVADGRRLPDRVPWNLPAPPAWLPDGSGFFCLTTEIGDNSVRMPIRKFTLGQPASDWAAPLPDGLTFPIPKVSRDGRYVTITTGNAEVRVGALITEDLQVIPLLEGIEGTFRGSVVDDALYALTDHDAPRGRIVAIPLATSTDPSTWTEILGETSDTLTDFEIFGDTLVVTSLRQCSAAIDVLDLKTGERTAVPLPGRGGIGAHTDQAAHLGLPAFERGDGEISFLYSDPATSPATYRYLVAEQRLELIEAPAMVEDTMSVRYLTAISADGVEVPAHVISRRDLDPGRPHPTLLHGYGGFRVADYPSYVGGIGAWIEAGGIYVLAHLRGGGQFGREWWRGGRRAHKQNSFNDFYAVAEMLIKEGLTTRPQLAAYGASNGGLLTAAALTQRPELWGAVVSDVPVTDLLTMDSHPLLYAIGRDEYGDPRVPQERAWLQAIDPLTNAAPADYPPTLVVAGANDPRCPAGQARSLVAKVAAAHTGAAPILLRVHAEQGHGASGVGAEASRLTEILAFCADHTGLRLGGP
jgi:prolyl oligopeptidase